MAGEPTRGGQRRGSKLFVDRQYYERGAAGGRIVTVSRRTQVLLAAGLAFSTVLCIVLVGAGVLGYRLYLEQSARLAALEALELEPGVAESGDTGAGPAAVAGGTLAEMLQAREARIGTLEQELALAHDDLAAAGTARAAVDEQLTREQEALRLKLEHADRMRLDAETELAASRARIAAMESELGAGGTAETLVDATGQPLASLESVTPGDLAQLGMELRLVERERDGAREQLDRALERLAALEASVGADPVATADDAGAAGAAADATADRLAELELAQSALQSENAQLTARLERRIAEQSEVRAAAEAGRRELVTQIASAETRIADEAARNGELEARLVALQQELDSAVAERATVIAERDAATENATAAAEARDALGRERDQLVEAQAILTAERDTLATLRDTLAAEREALMMGRDTLAAERDDLRARLVEAETANTDVAALHAELAAVLEASRAAEAELLDRDAERAALETSLAAEQERVASLTAELSAQRLSETADDSVAEDDVADGEAAAAAAAALSVLEERNRQLEAAVATAEAEADRATALAGDATLLAERSATVEPSIIAERDTALASAADAAAEVQRLRDDNATLTKASRDALDAQGAAHEAALEELRAELALLQDAVTARDSENAELVAANERLAAAAGTGADGSTSAALRAANERIEALEEELAVTARLAAELGSSPGTVPISAADIATVNGTASAAELELALERIKDLDAELSAAESRVSELQSLLEAEWPGPPRAAPR